METKICTKCGEEKPISEFYKDKQKSSGLRPDCKLCNSLKTKDYAKNNRQEINLNNLKYKTGLTKEAYRNLLAEQNNCCAICKITIDEHNKNLCVDHSHETGLIRGLLCTRCNQGLGYFLDNTELLSQAINYLNNNFSIKNLIYGYKK